MSIALVLDNLRSSYNVGSILRTADGLGVSKVFTLGITPLPISSGVEKTALGAHLSVSWQAFANYDVFLAELKRQGYVLWVVEQSSAAKNLSVISKLARAQEKIAIVVGNEAHGVSPELIREAQEVVEIPMVGMKKSFNVSVCAAIVAYELLKA